MGRKKKEALTEFNRNNILAAAKKLFVKKGVLQTTMDDISAEADCSKSTIYVYFKSKDEIFNSIVYEYILLLKKSLYESVNMSDDFETCYYSICNTFVTFQKEYPLYFESVLGEISVDAQDFKDQPVLAEIYKTGEEVNNIIVSFFERAQARGFIPTGTEPLPTAFVFWASICGIISIAGKKEKYFSQRLKMSKPDFLHYGFSLLLKSIRK